MGSPWWPTHDSTIHHESLLNQLHEIGCHLTRAWGRRSSFHVLSWNSTAWKWLCSVLVICGVGCLHNTYPRATRKKRKPRKNKLTRPRLEWGLLARHSHTVVWCVAVVDGAITPCSYPGWYGTFWINRLWIFPWCFLIRSFFPRISLSSITPLLTWTGVLCGLTDNDSDTSCNPERVQGHHGTPSRTRMTCENYMPPIQDTAGVLAIFTPGRSCV